MTDRRHSMKEATTESCRHCGFEHEPGLRFCGGCGRPAEPREEAGPSWPAAEAERRQITVVFCDLVDSTAISEHLDPEDWRNVVRSYQAACAEAVEPLAGHIAQYLGDGVLIYFGHPVAHEDDARRAVAAAMRILSGVAPLADRYREELDTSLRVRIGIHTGPVVVGTMGSRERSETLATGTAPLIAARLQSLAEPNRALLSATTHRLVGREYACRALGSRSLGEIAAPLEVFELLGARDPVELLTVGGADPTPMVSRQRELEWLLERWRMAEGGEGGAVLVHAEAGIGKSRLVRELWRQVDAGARRLECRCTSLYATSPLYPLIETISGWLGTQAEAAAGPRLAQLRSALRQEGLGDEEDCLLLADLLSLPEPEERRSPELSAARRKERTFDVVQRWLLAQASTGPLLFVFEDLHWADPSSLEWLGELADRLEGAGVLVVLTARPEFRWPWDPIMQIPLHRLQPAEAAAMVGQLAGRADLPEAVTAQLVARADGIPLFLEELTRTFLEAAGEHAAGGVGEDTDLDIPGTLHDLLMARLDRLGDARQLAQRAAVLGREFDLPVLAAIDSSPELEADLQRLIEDGVLQRRRRGGSRFTFRHVLVQEAAYSSLLRSERRREHRRIAVTLKAKFPAMAAEQPELLAYHFHRAALPADAVAHWSAAARRALERSATAEALSHIASGLELLPDLGSAEEAAHQEIRLRMLEGSALLATRGYGSPEVSAAYTRARSLCQGVKASRELFPVLRGLVPFYLVRAEMRIADELSDRLLELAQGEDDRGLLLEAHLAKATASYWLGEVADSNHHAHSGFDLYDPRAHRFHRLRYGQDPGVLCLLYQGWSLWWLGLAEQARGRIAAALELARSQGHPHTLAMACDHSCALYQYLRQPEGMRQLSEELVALAQAHGFGMWSAMGRFRQALIEMQLGDRTRGIAAVRESIELFQGTGSRIAHPMHLACLAEALIEAGRDDEAGATLDEAMAAAEQHSERHYEPELFRLRGVLIGASDPARGEAIVRQGMARAVAGEGRALELRGALSLFGLLERQGRRDEGRRQLEEVYGWFSEGLDEVDLRRARELLTNTGEAHD